MVCVSADLVMFAVGASVAIERANVLLRCEGYQVPDQLFVPGRPSTQAAYLGGGYPQCAHRLSEASKSFPSHFEATVCDPMQAIGAVGWSRCRWW